MSFINKRYGRLTVIGETIIKKKGKKSRGYLPCICECGEKCVVQKDLLSSGKTKSCGCLQKEGAKEQAKILSKQNKGKTSPLRRKPRVPMVGKIFSRLTVISQAAIKEYKNPNKPVYMWNCVCECGEKCVVNGHLLRTGGTKSCGCLQKEGASIRGKTLGALSTTHGLTNDPVYKTYHSMKRRCKAGNEEEFPNYAGRGIKVCQRWLDSFENFYADMGGRPDLYSIDRIDPNGNYEPDNCRWADNETQSLNRRKIIVTGVQLVKGKWEVWLNTKMLGSHTEFSDAAKMLSDELENTNGNGFKF